MEHFKDVIFRKILIPVVILSCLLSLSCQKQAEEIGPSPDYEAVAKELERFIQHEMADKDLPALSIALVDDQQTVWARAFGQSDPERKIPATTETVFRIGSVSKLFTDIAIMQLVEKGVLDLDKPVTEYIPEFQPKNPFKTPLTLRQLMSHRSGLLREPPVGNYFETSEPSLADTVLSLNQTELVFEPEARTKYSNAGIAVVGYVLEKTQGKPFAEYMKGAVLGPMDLERSSFAPEPGLVKDLAKAYMRTLDGDVFVAPTFEMGMSPAGCMYSTVTDLSRFISVLINRGKGVRGPVVQPGTLEKMWTPQYAETGQKEGFGLGFHVSEIDGQRCISHDGAIYGFATALNILPEAKLGVSVITTLDGANSVTERLAQRALKLMLDMKAGKALEPMELTQPVPAEMISKLEGYYSSEKSSVGLIEREGELFLSTGTGLYALRMLGERVILDDARGFTESLSLDKDQVKIGSRVYTRSEALKPEPVPERWKGLIGEYGWDHNILYVLERGGRLYTLIEWFFLYPLTEESPDVFAFPDFGLYVGEKMVFSRDGLGRANEVRASGVVFKRRTDEVEEGAGFFITPVRPIAELRTAALRARPPEEKGDFFQPDLVDLETFDPTIKLDIIYATSDNFLQAPFYEEPKAFLQRPAAEALIRVQSKLREKGYGLLVTDAYRPWYVTKMFWDATPKDKKIFVADPARGSRHNRGCAVDVTLYSLETGQPVQMVSGIDEMTDKSKAYYMGGEALRRWHRDLLIQVMKSEGFTVYLYEWWHFDFKGWEKYPILNLSFDDLIQ
jgi:CubicO group peptidase (beta-lactamase class C family)/D-alanyl-D-alanine dipeptidase